MVDGLLKTAPAIILAGTAGESGGEEGNTKKKIKRIFQKTLSPISVDKSVYKVSLPSKCRTFLYLEHVFA